MKAPVTHVKSDNIVHRSPHVTCMLTVVEPYRLVRRFGHPTTHKLMNLLQQSVVKDIGLDTRKVLRRFGKFVTLARGMLRNRGGLSLI